MRQADLTGARPAPAADQAGVLGRYPDDVGSRKRQGRWTAIHPAVSWVAGQQPHVPVLQ
jgi:hypothetical protein